MFIRIKKVENKIGSGFSLKTKISSFEDGTGIAGARTILSLEYRHSDKSQNPHIHKY